MTDDEYANELGWHALNYRAAGVQHAQGMWVELEACVNRLIAAAVAAETARCARLCDEIAERYTRRSTDYEGTRAAEDCADAIRAKEPKA